VTDPNLLAAFAPLFRVLDGLGVRYFVGGSIASPAHGVTRASVDVGEIVAELRAAHVGRIGSALREGYYVSEERVRDERVRS
jgi:hypothetical protein